MLALQQALAGNPLVAKIAPQMGIVQAAKASPVMNAPRDPRALALEGLRQQGSSTDPVQGGLAEALSRLGTSFMARKAGGMR